MVDYLKPSDEFGDVRKITVNCKDCQTEIETTVFAGMQNPVLVCNPCADIRERRGAKEKEAEKSISFQKRMQESGIDPEYVSNWKRAKAYKAGLSFDIIWRDRLENLSFMYSQSGINKTWSMSIGAWEMSKRGEVDSCRMIVCPDWIADVCVKMGSDGETAENMIKDVQRVGLLVLDDLGRGKMTERASEVVWRIIDYRTRAGGNRFITWVNSNCSGIDLENKFASNGGTIMRRIRDQFKQVKLEDCKTIEDNHSYRQEEDI